MRLIFLKNLKAEKGIDYVPEHIARLIEAGKLPKPIRINRGNLAFIESELDAVIEQLAAGRDLTQAVTEPPSSVPGGRNKRKILRIKGGAL